MRRLVGTVVHSRLFFVTDEPLHPFFERVRDLGGEVLGVESEAEELRLIHSFQKVAISQDALQWWGAFLGAAREIYFPQIERGIWSHPAPALLAHDPWWHGIDLRVPEDGRYVYDW